MKKEKSLVEARDDSLMARAERLERFLESEDVGLSLDQKTL